jgi:hypothetical protein
VAAGSASGGVRKLLSSPRRRRRLRWLAIVMAAVAAIAVLIVFVRNTANDKQVIRSGKPQRAVVRKPVRLSKSELRRVHATAVKFIETAVVRRHVDESWDITDPTLKAGFTRERWAKGDIPAIPYPADTPQYAPYKLLYSYKNDTALVIALLPTHDHPDYNPSSFTVELLKRNGRWLVSSFTPRKLGGVDAVQQSAELKNAARENAAGENGPTKAASSSAGDSSKATLSAVWLAVPGALLALLLLIPIGLGIRGWLRGRRAMRDYPPPPSPFSS